MRNTILGISIGTRTSGIAVIEDTELIHWQTHSFLGKWSEQKARKILQRFSLYLNQYHPQAVIVKVPPTTHQSIPLVTILKALVSLIQPPGCMVQVSTKKDIKERVPEITNTDTLLQYVVSRYPILQTEYEQERASAEAYHLRMFEAVLAAHLYKDNSP